MNKWTRLLCRHILRLLRLNKKIRHYSLFTHLNIPLHMCSRRLVFAILNMPCLQLSDILISTCHFTFNHFPHSCTRFLLFIYSAVILLFWHSFLFEFLLFVDLWVISLFSDLRFSLFFHFCCSPKCECHRSTVKTPRANFLLFPSTAIDLSFPPDLHRRCSLNDWSELAFFVTFKFSFFTQLLSLLCVEGKKLRMVRAFPCEREENSWKVWESLARVSFIARQIRPRAHRFVIVAREWQQLSYHQLGSVSLLWAEKWSERARECSLMRYN